MYSTDVPAIRARALASPDGLAGAILFALLSIRQPFGTLNTATRDVAQRGSLSKYLWGFKRVAYDYVQEHKVTLWAEVCAATDAVEAIDVLSRVPGLGLVKAGFVAQMLGHDVACFDSRNLETLELTGRAFRFEKARLKRPATRRRKIAEYVEITRDTGGAAHWWDHWCAGIAPSLGATAREVSGWHVRYVERLAA